MAAVFSALHAMSGLKTSPTLLGDFRTDSRTVLDVASTNLIIACEDETLHDAIARVLRHDVGRLPVVDRGNEKRVVEYLGRASILVGRERNHRDEQLGDLGIRKAELIELQNV